eukprot:38481-Amphidinium_carterae.1
MSCERMSSCDSSCPNTGSHADSTTGQTRQYPSRAAKQPHTKRDEARTDQASRSYIWRGTVGATDQEERELKLGVV